MQEYDDDFFFEEDKMYVSILNVLSCCLSLTSLCRTLSCVWVGCLLFVTSLMYQRVQILPFYDPNCPTMLTIGHTMYEDKM